jgi:hypothetical protein
MPNAFALAIALSPDSRCRSYLNPPPPPEYAVLVRTLVCRRLVLDNDTHTHTHRTSG